MWCGIYSPARLRHLAPSGGWAVGGSWRNLGGQGGGQWERQVDRPTDVGRRQGEKAERIDWLPGSGWKKKEERERKEKEIKEKKRKEKEITKYGKGKKIQRGRT